MLSALADRATEGVLQLAKEADPREERTLGILTKTDLVREDTVRRTILGVVRGTTLKLGYFAVCNRGADDDDIGIERCRQKEKDFFAQPEWSDLVRTGRAGVEALRLQLRILLTDLAKREFPKQRAEVAKRLAECRRMLEAMGDPRSNAYGQRQCLIKLASEFERVVRDALDGRYDGDMLFTLKPELKLITRILHLNEGFSGTMWKLGHTRPFYNPPFQNDSRVSLEFEPPILIEKKGKQAKKPDARVMEYEETLSQLHSAGYALPELRDIVTAEDFVCPVLSTSPSIMDHIKESYETSRGPELGTISHII